MLQESLYKHSTVNNRKNERWDIGIGATSSRVTRVAANTKTKKHKQATCGLMLKAPVTQPVLLAGGTDTPTARVESVVPVLHRPRAQVQRL